jgi:hypothetical protein
MARFGVLPDEPAAVVGPRPRGSRRPHTDPTVTKVRRLIEPDRADLWRDRGAHWSRTRLHRRWARGGGWQRPVFAPSATDTVPSARPAPG